MAIVTLLNHLKNNKLKHNILVNDVYLPNIIIEHYEINKENCWIDLDNGSEIKIDISDYKQFRFNAIVSSPADSIEMYRCLKYLHENEKGSFNAYLENSKEKSIIDFYNIRIQSPTTPML
jgi:hypothetical protein